MKLPRLFIPEKDLENSVERLLKDHGKVQQGYDNFEIIKANTYAEGIAKLKEQGRRLLTFFENVEARIADYELNGDDAELFKIWLDSVTGIAYKAKSTKFKLILRSNKLENISKDFNQSFIPINYDNEQGIELDSRKGMYDKLLTREGVKNHEFWIAVMNGDEEKLARYVDIWFDRTKAKEGMGVYLRSNTNSDELRALVLNSGNYSSSANGCDLGCSARFASGAQQK